MMIMLSINLFIVYFLTYSAYVHGQNRCEAFIDLTLIVDSSGSVSPTDFEEAKKALLDLVSKLNVGTEKAGVALINYASTVSLSAQTDVFEFDRIDLLQQIAALPRLATNTATGDALELARTYCETQCRDITKAIPRVFAVFTDGHSNEGRPAIPASDTLRADPIQGTVFAIGIGNIGAVGDAELLGLAGGDPDYKMNIASYLDFARLTNLITMTMCDFPAFVLPDVPILGEASSNSTRYYKMNTLNRVNRNAFFEIEFNDRVGQAAVYTSSTNKKPSSHSSKSTVTRAANGKKIYTTYVPSTAKNFYFGVKGVAANLNKFDFIVRLRPL